MSVAFLVEVPLVQLHLLRLAEQYSLLVLPVLGVNFSSARSAFTSSSSSPMCGVVMRQGDSHTSIAFYIMSFIN